MFQAFALSCGSFRSVPLIALLSVACPQRQQSLSKSLNWFGFIELLLRLSWVMLPVYRHYIVFFAFEYSDFQLFEGFLKINLCILFYFIL